MKDANHTLKAGSTLRSNSKQDAPNRESNAEVRQRDKGRLFVKVNSTLETGFVKAIRLSL